MIDAAPQVLDSTAHKVDIKFYVEMPGGPRNRVADNRLAKRLLGWEPQAKFPEGLLMTALLTRI